MADNANVVVRTEINGYRNVVIRASLVSDGSGLTDFKLYDATRPRALSASPRLAVRSSIPASTRRWWGSTTTFRT